MSATIDPQEVTFPGLAKNESDPFLGGGEGMIITESIAAGVAGVAVVAESGVATDDFNESTDSPEVKEETAAPKKRGRKPNIKNTATPTKGENADADESTVTATPTPKKRGRKPKKPATAGTGGEENAADDEPATPKAAAPKKRGPRAKKDVTPNVNDNVDETNAAAEPSTPANEPITEPKTKSSGKKRAAAANLETPTKKAKVKADNGEASAKKARAKSDKLPECLAEFSEADRLILDMKKSGNSWDKITEAWTTLTGAAPGKDVLRKRYPKLQAVAQDWKAGDASRLAVIKLRVDQEVQAAHKKLDNEKWATIAAAITGEGGDAYPPAAVEKKWSTLKSAGQIDSQGNYVGSDIGEDAAGEAEDGTSAGGDDVGAEQGDVAGELGRENAESEVDDSMLEA